MTSCQQCGAQLSTADRFCRQCGASLSDAADRDPGPSAEERIALLCRYLPPPLVHHLMTERSAPLGQRAIAAVVFADISGFTAMSETMDPEDVLRVMNGCFEGLVEAVERHGGTVDKFIGDCLMAIFGVPEAHGDDAVRAVRACQEMYDYLDSYNQTLEKPLGLSVGVNFGPLVAGNLGSATRMDFTVMGDAVNLAQRLESAATAGQILVSDAVEQAARQEITFQPLSPIRVKGKKDPVHIFVVDREAQPQKVRTVLPCVGRNPLLRAVTAALENAIATGVIVDLSGEPGVGQTRLVQALVDEWHATPRAYLATLPAADRPRPFGGIGALVEAACGINVADPLTTRLQKLPRLTELEIRADWVPFLAHAAGAGQARLSHLDGPSLENGIRAAFRALLDRLATRGEPVVLDGLQRLDAESRRIWVELLTSGPPVGLRLVTTRHPETPLLSNGPWTRTAIVPPLSADATRQLAALRLQLEQLPERAAAFLLEQTHGNPRYLLELIGSLLDAGYIYPGDRGYLVRDDLATSTQGLTLANVVQSRIDALSPDKKHLLQAGAIFGDSFPADIVSTAAGEPRSGPQWLAEIASRGLIRRHGTLYQFEHALIRRAAIDSLLRAEQSGLSEKLGAALAAHPDGQKPASLPLLARLFAAGNDAGKAVYYLERGGNHLLRLGEYMPAAEMFEQLLARLAQADAPAEKVIRGQLLAGRAWELAGDLTRATTVLSAAEATARQAQSALLATTASRLRARLLRVGGDLNGAAQQVETALQWSERSQDPHARAWVHLEAGEINLAQQQPEVARSHFVEARNIGADLPTSSDPEGSVRGRAIGRLGRLALTEQDPETALALLAEAAAVCEAANDQRELVRLYGNLGVLGHQHQRDEARAHFDRAITIAREIGDKLGEAKQRHNLGSYLTSIGDADTAATCFWQSHELAQALGWKEGVAVNASALQAIQLRDHQDASTGLHNTAYFKERLGHEIHRAQRHHRVLSILLIELPGLTQIGQQQGLAERQQVLRNAAGRLRPPTLRTSDVAARFDDQTLAVILPETGAAGCQTLAARLAEEIAGCGPRTAEGAPRNQLVVKLGSATLGADGVEPFSLVSSALAALGHAPRQS